ncbi:MAG: hypothetical protein WBO55_16575 [Rhizobiaceae bacterium]
MLNLSLFKMKRISASFLIFLATFGVSFADCADDMIANMEQMASLALQCGERADLIASITSRSGRLDINDLSNSCRQRVDNTGQLDAFNECSRVYICAAQAYAYALDHLSEHGGDCSAAAAEALIYFPVN